jgi:hypothetical protein
MPKTTRRTAAQRVAAKQDRARADLISRARRAIDRVKALAELDDLRDRTSYTGSTLRGPLGIGHTAVIICIPPATTELIHPGVEHVSWHLNPAAARAAAHTAAANAGNDHRARIAELEQLIKETP